MHRRNTLREITNIRIVEESAVENNSELVPVNSSIYNYKSALLKVYFRRYLPAEICRHILLLSWSLPCRSVTHRQLCSVSASEKVLLELQLIRKPLAISLIAKSHDQGWSSFPEDQGTYRNSWTYGILRTNTVEEKCYNNLHAESMWQIHEKWYPHNSNFVQNLNSGDTIQLVIKADFGGWTNSVCFAELTAYYDIQ
eukprot:NODE_24_length_41419_cov_0.818780.p24 type:complete len:197 gc:universal NODE_24_length_41419_cov_0.818780:20698-21288(+)